MSVATHPPSCRGPPAWSVRRSRSSSPGSRSTASWPGLLRRWSSRHSHIVTLPEQEFRDFVASFADPLARFAFLLSDGTELSSVDMTVAALAAVRRRWSDVEATGAPEPLAIEELVSALPRSRRAAALGSGGPVADLVEVTRPAAPVAPAVGQLPDGGADAGLLLSLIHISEPTRQAEY